MSLINRNYGENNKPFLMGTPEAHDAHKKWYPTQLASSNERAFPSGSNEPVDLSPLTSMIPSVLEGLERSQPEKEAEPMEASDLEKSFFDKLRGR